MRRAATDTNSEELVHKLRTVEADRLTLESAHKTKVLELETVLQEKVLELTEVAGKCVQLETRLRKSEDQCQRVMVEVCVCTGPGANPAVCDPLEVMCCLDCVWDMDGLGGVSCPEGRASRQTTPALCDPPPPMRHTTPGHSY